MRISASVRVMSCALLAWALSGCGEGRPVIGGGGGGVCSACHGDPTRTAVDGADVHVNAAPPVDTKGQTSSDAVGAHIAHVNPGVGALSRPVACAECHVVPTSADHQNGTVDMAFGALAKTGGASPSWNAPSLSCSATYCHGTFAKYGLAATPIWNAPATGQCGTCHGIPPALATGHPQNTNCGACHPGYSSTSVNTTLHVNGVKDIGGAACTSCHGDAGRTPVAGADPNVQAAPPVTATGRSAGAHLAHVNKTGEMMTPAQCAECHSGAVPSSTESHPSGTITVTFSGRATTGGQSPTYDSTSLSCSATYCHGGFTGGANATPTWTGGAMSCSSCHGVPPSTGQHQRSQHLSAGCGACHSGYTATAANATLHVNGAKDVGGAGTSINSWNAATRSCSPSCHGTETW